MKREKDKLIKILLKKIISKNIKKPSNIMISVFLSFSLHILMLILINVLLQNPQGIINIEKVNIKPVEIQLASNFVNFQTSNSTEKFLENKIGENQNKFFQNIKEKQDIGKKDIKKQDIKTNEIDKSESKEEKYKDKKFKDEGKGEDKQKIDKQVIEKENINENINNKELNNLPNNNESIENASGENKSSSQSSNSSSDLPSNIDSEGSSNPSQQYPQNLTQSTQEYGNTDGSDGFSNQDIFQYSLNISSLFNYPKDALKLGIQGTVKLKLLIDKYGKVINVVLLESSGSKILDNYTTTQARQLLFSFPEDKKPQSSFWIVIKVVYSIKTNVTVESTS